VIGNACAYVRFGKLPQAEGITGHQAFFTREALLNIAATTIDNITKFENSQPLEKLAG
jgi:lactate dehydrogenase-like 2-hydroxyacid dehydrogenase